MGTVDERMGKERERDGSAFRSPWVWGWIAMVVVVFLANLTMVVIARVTSPGLVVRDYYEKGKNYNKTLKARAAEDALGWNATITSPDGLLVDRPSRITFSVVDSKGRPVDADYVELHSFRPSDAGADFSVPLTEISPGVYEGSVVYPLPGIWDIIVSVKRGDDTFESPQRIFIDKPEKGAN